jgi:hypothetical protein
VIAILAFSTTAAYYGEFTLNRPCNYTTTGKNLHVTGKFSFSFSKLDVYIDETECSTPKLATHNSKDLPSSLKSSSEFFVFVGVTSFLYCIFAMIYYVRRCYKDSADDESEDKEKEVECFPIVVSYIGH